MGDWESKGRDNWRRNRKTRAQEIKRAIEFEEREIRIYKNMLQREMDYNTNDMIGGIDSFGENLQRQGIEQNRTIAEAM